MTKQRQAVDRSAHISAYVQPQQKAKLQALAQRHGLSVNRMVALLIDMAVDGYAMKEATVEAEEASEQA